MKFFFEIRQRDIDAEFLQCFLIGGFSLHIKQGVTNIEPYKRYIQIQPLVKKGRLTNVERRMMESLSAIVAFGHYPRFVTTSAG